MNANEPQIDRGLPFVDDSQADIFDAVTNNDGELSADDTLINVLGAVSNAKGGCRSRFPVSGHFQAI